jgi:serine/threonine protein kinase/tetratricopeptide (TPR) repeat protein
MTPERYERLRQLFLEARDTSGRQREAFLQQACGSDGALRRELDSLLANAEQADSFLKSPALGSNFALGSPKTVAVDWTDAEFGGRPSQESLAAPEQIGPFRVLSPLGQGGMGTVYLAEQSEPVRRLVALKLIKPGMDSRQVVARFEAERQALAMMDHPCIARIFDGGAVPPGSPGAGSPYFVMEYVRGVPLTEYCDARQLSLKDRLELFIRLCEAVQHAHQKGVIHRDIKPSNILVEQESGVATPKIIDFGVAKAIGPPLTERTLVTEMGQLIGTPAYMSPEQAGMSGQDIDTRTDVYALGVLLYELLSGSLPFDPQTLRGGSLAEIQRIICEVEPPKPSTKLSRLGVSDRVAAVARNRKADSRALMRSLRHELDWIVMKCLEKDRSRRYETVNDLAADVRRYLNNEPILAGPPSTVYRLRKFVRRNRGAVVAGVLVAATLVIGMISTATFAVRASRQRQIAQDEAARAEAAMLKEAQQRLAAERNQEKAQQIQYFLQRMLESVTPATARDRDVTLLREMLDHSARAADKELSEEPEVLAAVRSTIGITYLGLGLFDEAEKHLTASLEMRRRLLGDEHIDVADNLSTLGSLKCQTSDYAGARTMLEEAVAIKRKLLPEDDPGLDSTLNNLANALDNLGKFEEAEKIHREVLARRRKAFGNQHSDVALSLNNLGFLLMNKGKNEEAEEMFREALAIRQKLHGDDHPDVALSLLNLGHLLGRTSRYAEAEPLLAKALDIRRRVSGKDHPDTGYALNGLAANYSKQNNHAAAEPLFREALPILRKAYGDTDWRVIRVTGSLAGSLRALGKYKEAEELLLAAEEVLGQSPDKNAQPLRGVRQNLVELYEAWHAAEPDDGHDHAAAECKARIAASQPAT